jgi:hypothetical protein
MKRLHLTHAICVAVLLLPSLAGVRAGAAQDQTLQQKIAQIKQLVAQNRQQLARYTWQTQETVSVRGEVKRQTVFRVALGAGGKPVRTVLSQTSPGAPARQFGIRHRVEERYQDYAAQVGALAQSYAQLDPATISQLYAQGNVAVRPAAGSPGYVQLVLSNYLKRGDSIVLTLAQHPRALISINVSSYLDEPSNAVTIQTRLAKLADGTQYPSTVIVNGESKDLTITDHSSGFEIKAP